MDQPIDVYSDQFQINLGPYGSSLNFMVSDPTPPAPGSATPARRLATIRMSLQHLKVMTFILRKQISAMESQTGVKAEVPVELLNSLRTSREDWDAFWKTS